MASMDCSTAMKLTALIVLCGMIMVTVVSHYILQRYTAEEEWKQGEIEEITEKEEKFAACFQPSEQDDPYRGSLNERLTDLSERYGRVGPLTGTTAGGRGE